MGETVKSNKDVVYDLYSKNIASDEIVMLSENGQASGCVGYTVFAIKASDMPSVTVIGDVNADGKFDITDVVLLQKWLLAVPDVKLAYWKAGDLCEDNKLNVFDLCLMKRELISQKLV